MTFMKYDLEKMVSENHVLRKVSKVISFKELAWEFKDLERKTGRRGYGVETGIRCLFLQFYYDLSDREMEERLRYDISLRWFVGISLEQESPDHSYFGRMREALGTKGMRKIFRNINQKAQDRGILRDVFTFVDASAIRTKETTWAERDKAIQEGEEALNNKNVENYSADKDARFGCKGKSKFWYGYKRHIGADMGSGMIKEVDVTPANVTDQDGLDGVCPKGGMLFGDKSYCVSTAQETMKKNGCHSGAILKNNMKKKNKDKDRWLTKVRAPFENIFSKMMNRARYRGLNKVSGQVLLEAIVFNVKRLLAINSPPLFAAGA